MYKKILLPLDGSEHSKRAVDAVLTLLEGRESESSVLLLHVAPKLVYGPEMVHLDLDFEAIARREGEQIVSFATEKFNLKGIKYNVLVEIGDPAREIYLHAKHHECDLIVMGSRGLGTFGEMLLGSVSHKVLSQVSCPVMIIH